MNHQHQQPMRGPQTYDELRFRESFRSMPAKAHIEIIPCKVCGDRSSGIHYGIITCEGCKGFFRRSQQNKARYQCPRNGACLIDRTNRNRCQHCRLKKCISLGMSREAVKFGRMSKKQRDQLYLEVIKHQNSTLEQNHSDYPIPNQQYGYMNQCIPSPEFMQAYHSNQPSQNSGPHPGQNPSQHFMAQHMARQYQQQVQQQQHQVQNQPQMQQPIDIKIESQTQGYMQGYQQADQSINELSVNIITAFNKTIQYTRDEICQMSQTVYSEEETETFRDMAKEDFWKVWAEEMSGGIQHVVEFAKNMSCFMDLKHQKSGEHDQVTLLRSGCLELLLIRMARLVNTNNSTLLFNKKFATTEIFESLECKDLIDLIFKVISNLAKLNLNDQEFALLSAALLMTNNRVGLKDVIKVQEKQTMIIAALRQKMVQRGVNPLPLLTKISEILPDIAHLSEMHKTVVASLRSEFPLVEHPLLYNEIFQTQITAQTIPSPTAQSSPLPPKVITPEKVDKYQEERLSPDIIPGNETVSFSDLELNSENLSGISFNPYSQLAAYGIELSQEQLVAFTNAESSPKYSSPNNSDYGSCQTNIFNGSIGSSETDSGTTSPERKFSNEIDSPITIKLENLESQIGERYGNAHLFGNMGHFIPHFSPQLLPTPTAESN